MSFVPVMFANFFFTVSAILNTLSRCFPDIRTATGAEGGGPSGREPQWWWDDAEGVVYFGDPDLRIFVPGTKYSEENKWKEPVSLNYDKELTIQGHSPFGAIKHTHSKKPSGILEKYIWLILVIFIIILLLVILVKMKKGRKK